MNAIKLPVRAYQLGVHPLWNVRDANNLRLAIDLDEAHAKQIALALNLHDELVRTLKEALGEIKGVRGSARLYNYGMEVLKEAKP